MTDLDPKWLGAVLAKHSSDNSVVNVLSITTSPGAGVGDNYVSIAICATVKVVLGSGRVATRKVFIKKKMTGLTQDIAGVFSEAYLLESLVYSKVLPTFESLIWDNSLTYYDKFWPECMYTSNNLVIFEDLKAHGFKLADRKSGLDYRHVNLVLKHLARYHCLSIAAISNGTLYPKIFPELIFIRDGGDKFFKTALTALADVIRDSWNAEWSDFGKKIRSLVANLTETLTDLYQEPHELSVLNHGDCWVNNIMFKYDSVGTPTELKFFDFQLSHYNSYAWDLIYFIYSSAHLKDIINNLDSLLEVYCKEFSDNLKLLGYDTCKAPTVQEAKEEMKRLHPFAVVVSGADLPVMRNPSDVELSLNDLTSNVSKLRLVFKDEGVVNHLQGIFKHFLNG